MTDNDRRKVVQIMFLYSFKKKGLDWAMQQMSFLPAEIADDLLDIFSEIDPDPEVYVDTFNLFNSEIPSDEIIAKIKE